VESTRVETDQASDSTLLRTVASSIDLNLPLRNERETLLRTETISSTQGSDNYFNKMLSKTKRTRSCSSKRSDSQPWVETLVAEVQIKSRVRKAKAHLVFQWTLKTVAWVLSNRFIARQEVARANPQHKMTTWMGLSRCQTTETTEWKCKGICSKTFRKDRRASTLTSQV